MFKNTKGLPKAGWMSSAHMGIRVLLYLAEHYHFADSAGRNSSDLQSAVGQGMIEAIDHNQKVQPATSQTMPNNLLILAACRRENSYIRVIRVPFFVSPTAC